METVLIAGVFGLLGAVVGSVLTGIVQRVVQVQTARAERIDTAIRSVAVAMAAGNFVWSVGMKGAPRNLTVEDEAESSRAMYLKGIERYMTALHEAKRDLNIVRADGVDTGLPPDFFVGNPTDKDLELAYDALVRVRGAKRRVFT